MQEGEKKVMYNGQQAIIASSRPKISATKVSAGSALVVLGTVIIGMIASGKTELSFWPEDILLIVSALFIFSGICLLYRAASISKSEIIIYDGGVRGRAIQENCSPRGKAQYVDFDIRIEDIQAVSSLQNAVAIKSFEKSLCAYCDTEKTARELAELIQSQLREKQLIAN